jgi:hypothetical protein
MGTLNKSKGFAGSSAFWSRSNSYDKKRIEIVGVFMLKEYFALLISSLYLINPVAGINVVNSSNNCLLDRYFAAVSQPGFWHMSCLTHQAM